MAAVIIVDKMLQLSPYVYSSRDEKERWHQLYSA